MAISNYSEIKPFRDFALVVEEEVYRPLPDNWLIGISDVVDSTSAIQAGQYKAVNMAGAATISAITNTLAGKPFPFVFRGDGARFAISPDDAETVREAMSKTATWVRTELKLTLRVALVPIEIIRQARRDIHIARYAASPGLSHAIFTGGGMEWAARQAKAGRFTVEPATPGNAPDLTGLSCQWQPLHSANGVILSMIVKPRSNADRKAFAATIYELLARLEHERRINPVPESGPQVHRPSESLDLRSRVIRPGSGSRATRRLLVLFQSLLAWLLSRTRWKIGDFDPNRHRRHIAPNTDFRKYDDGLMMTVDCSKDCAGDLERILQLARSDGIVDYGLHQQKTALMTCTIPSVSSDDRLHLVDGGSGGYARAAQQLRGAVNESY